MTITAMIAVRRLFGLLNWLVALGVGCGGKTVVGAVTRFTLATVLLGRMLV